ncbi:S-adenosyl-L-methionine-dependent methyltransferase [Pavlovales sp. CCMP2436]|nr:S-adenosyl-L-methionine-dependent methyltransferase [Pavlovales sp. CCMP2436]
MASSANLSSGGLEGLCNETTARWFYAWYSPYYDRLQKYFSSPHMREKGLDMAGVGGAEQRVLDVGAGTGTLTTQVLSRGALPGNVVMLDQSEGMLAQAKKKLQLNGVRKVLGDAQDLPFSDESFDRTISSGAIYYWPDAVRGMREQYRVLKPGGRALAIGTLQPSGLGIRILAQAASLSRARPGPIGLVILALQYAIAMAAFAIIGPIQILVASRHFKKRSE